MSWNTDKACTHAAVEARLISAWSTDMESKCGQEKDKVAYTFLFLVQVDISGLLLDLQQELVLEIGLRRSGN